MEKYLLWLLTVVIFLFSCRNIIEHYGSGALIQLFSKGPQDTYLTADAEKYLWYPFSPYGYMESVWNNPTRYSPLYYPYFYTRDIYPQFGPKIYY